MKKLLVSGISFFVISSLFCSLALAQNISADYPEEAECIEEFKTEIELMDFEEGVYDVKIDIKDKNGARVSKILDENEWKSTHYYVNDAIDYPDGKNKRFALKIFQDYEGKAYMEIKIRDSSDKVRSFSGYEIEVGCSEKETREKDTEGQDKSEGQSLQNDEEISEIAEDSRADNEEEKETGEKLEARSIIKLNEPKGINIAENQSVYKSKTQYIKEYAIYGFALFCVIVIVMMIIKNKKW